MSERDDTIEPDGPAGSPEESDRSVEAMGADEATATSEAEAEAGPEVETGPEVDVDEPDGSGSPSGPGVSDEPGTAPPLERDPLDLSVPVDVLDPLPEESVVSAPPAPAKSFDDVVRDVVVDSPVELDGGKPLDELPPAKAPTVGPRQVAAGAPATGWRAFGRAMRPRLNRSQVLAALLCGALGFALVVQVQQSQQDPLSSARQDDLVRLLDEVTQRAEQLDEEVAELTRTRDELASGTGQAQAAVDLAEQRAQSEGILSGRLPAVGPGLEIVVRDPSGATPAAKLFNVLEELRNAGAEVVELNGIRLVTSSWFLDTEDGVTVDGQVIDSPYRWTVIGDPDTLSPALEIPGGALAQVRTENVDARVVSEDEVEISAVREPAAPQYATPRSPEG